MINQQSTDAIAKVGKLRKRGVSGGAHDRFRGCLLGGAVGDALGAPVEFLSRAQILLRFGPEGITQYASAYGRFGAITDDTQMTLFTAEGLLRGWVRGCLKGITTYTGVTAHAYLRWLRTQGVKPSQDIEFGQDEPGWLASHQALYSPRAPGNTCLSALQQMESLGQPARNDSKGCGGVMRVAPVGLFMAKLVETPEAAFKLGTELAALTHGHPTGGLAAGVLAVLVQALVDGASLGEAIDVAKACLRSWPRHEETLDALELAEALAGGSLPTEESIKSIGRGWVAEEALAIAVYCAMVARSFKEGVLLAVNHDGDSDSTGSITGNLLGARFGVNAVPTEWLDQLELRDVITELASDLFQFPEWDLDERTSDGELSRRIWKKYPGF